MADTIRQHRLTGSCYFCIMEISKKKNMNVTRHELGWSIGSNLKFLDQSWQNWKSQEDRDCRRKIPRPSRQMDNPGQDSTKRKNSTSLVTDVRNENSESVAMDENRKFEIPRVPWWMNRFLQARWRISWTRRIVASEQMYETRCWTSDDSVDNDNWTKNVGCPQETLSWYWAHPKVLWMIVTKWSHRPMCLMIPIVTNESSTRMMSTLEQSNSCTPWGRRHSGIQTRRNVDIRWRRRSQNACKITVNWVTGSDVPKTRSIQRRQYLTRWSMLSHCPLCQRENKWHHSVQEEYRHVYFWTCDCVSRRDKRKSTRIEMEYDLREQTVRDVESAKTFSNAGQTRRRERARAWDSSCAMPKMTRCFSGRQRCHDEAFTESGSTHDQRIQTFVIQICCPSHDYDLGIRCWSWQGRQLVRS